MLCRRRSQRSFQQRSLGCANVLSHGALGSLGLALAYVAHDRLMLEMGALESARGVRRLGHEQMPNWRKVYTDFANFRRDQNVWFRFTEAQFDRYMQSANL